MRLILWHLFLLVLPFILYGSYLTLTRRKREQPTGNLKDVPLNMLFGSGLALMIISLLTFRLLDPGGDVQSTYTPTRVEDGKLIEGEVVPKQTAPEE